MSSICQVVHLKSGQPKPPFFFVNCTFKAASLRSRRCCSEDSFPSRVSSEASVKFVERRDFDWNKTQKKNEKIKDLPYSKLELVDKIEHLENLKQKTLESQKAIFLEKKICKVKEKVKAKKSEKTHWTSKLSCCPNIILIHPHLVLV